MGRGRGKEDASEKAGKKGRKKRGRWRRGMRKRGGSCRGGVDEEEKEEDGRMKRGKGAVSPWEEGEEEEKSSGKGSTWIFLPLLTKLIRFFFWSAIAAFTGISAVTYCPLHPIEHCNEYMYV